jgi:hypothetical protein
METQCLYQSFSIGSVLLIERLLQSSFMDILSLEIVDERRITASRDQPSYMEEAAEKKPLK